MTLAAILYASMSGNNEEVADIVEKYLEEENIEVKKEEADDVDVHFFDDADICIVHSYTYTDGEIPNELEEMYDGLAETDFQGKIFGIAGAGDSNYDTFCHAVELLDEAFAKTGAVRGADMVKIDDKPEPSDEEALLAFVKSLAAKVN